MHKQCDWVVVHDGTQGVNAYALECLRCGQMQKVAMPISIDCWCAMAKAFERTHRHCRNGDTKKELR